MNDHEQGREQFPSREREAQFQPEIVDEQIDRLRWSRRQQKASMAPDEQLIGDLHTLHALHRAHAGTRERVWQRLEERIASNDASRVPLSAEHENSVQKPNRSFERHHIMKHEISHPQRSHMQRLGLIAAVVFTALVVGSMAWIFTLARHHNDGTDVASTGGTTRQTEKQQQQASSSGIYVNVGKSLLRVEPQTGKVIWRYDLPTIAVPYMKDKNAVTFVKYVLVGDTVYAVIDSSSSQYKTSIVALNAGSGQKLWSQPLTGGPSSFMDMVVANSVIYAVVQSGQGNAATYAVDSFASTDGKQGATYQVPAFIYGITPLNGKLYVATQDGLYAFDTTSHQQSWHDALQTETAQQTLVVTPPHIVNGILYAAVVSDNEAGPTVSRLEAFSADSGQLLWRSDPVQGQVSDVAISNGVVYFAAAIPQVGPFKGALYAYDAQKGKQLWNQPTDGGVQWAPSVSNGVVYVSAYVGYSQSENVQAFRVSDGKQLWKHQIMAGMMTTPYEQNGFVYVASGFNGGKLYALNARDGAQAWSLDLGSGPQVISVVS